MIYCFSSHFVFHHLYNFYCRFRTYLYFPLAGSTNIQLENTQCSKTRKCAEISTYLVVGVLVIVDPKDVGVSLPAAVDRVDNVAQTDRLLKKRI